MDSENLRNRSPDLLQQVWGTNADLCLQHRPTWDLEDPWTHRETVLACATPDANQFRSLILRLRRYELSIPRIYLVSRLSEVWLLKASRRPESTADFFVVSQRSQKICRSLSQRGRTEIPPENPKLKNNSRYSTKRLWKGEIISLTGF